jgi:biopolymer transport protein ExbD
MRKCSNPVHHSLSELNITPLLDLAFVLLVIFIITTTPIVNDLNVNLPPAAKRLKDPPRKANYVTVDTQGNIYLNKAVVTPDGLLHELIAIRSANNGEDKDISVIVRADSKTKYSKILTVMDCLQRAQVLKVDLETSPKPGN